ncbi:penicillin-binding protein 2 [Verrucomicrobia bacterium LW23]|nr:penicillin-binding protein 2 [Verrucomicrobia bacterium LW23]
MTRQTSASIILFALCLGFTAVSARLVQLQLIQHEHFAKKADANHWRRQVLPGRRGIIVDTHGSLLARTLIKYDLRLDPKDFGKEVDRVRMVDGKRKVERVRIVDEVLPKIAEILNAPEMEMRNAFLAEHNKELARQPINRRVLLARDITEQQVAEIRALKAHNLVIEERPVRDWPYGPLASHVIGYLGPEGTGAMGVEKEMEEQLKGVAGYQEMETDRQRREIAAFGKRYVAPQQGKTVVLTLDAVIQTIVEEEMAHLVNENKPSAAYVVVMRPKTGEILAMANYPTCDFNNRKDIAPEAMRNRCMTDQFEPGSTFKIIAMAAGLNEGLIKPTSNIFCENGQYFYASHVLRDHAAYGMLSVNEIMKVSSNIGTAKVAQMLGADQLFYYCQLFGIGQQTGLFTGQREAPGTLHPLNRWHKVTIVQVPMGQGVAVTALQMTQAFAVIANGGKFVAPQIIKEVRDGENQVIQPFEPRIVRQVVSARVAKQVTDALRDVVDAEGGTGSLARVNGYSSAGKTGTAQKAGRGGYVKGKYVSSFIGFVPAENPEFVVSVIVDEPSGPGHYGGAVSGPTFSRISERVARYLNIPPDQPVREPVPGKGTKPLPEPDRTRTQQATL